MLVLLRWFKILCQGHVTFGVHLPFPCEVILGCGHLPQLSIEPLIIPFHLRESVQCSIFLSKRCFIPPQLEEKKDKGLNLVCFAWHLGDLVRHLRIVLTSQSYFWKLGVEWWHFSCPSFHLNQEDPLKLESQI